MLLIRLCLVILNFFLFSCKTASLLKSELADVSQNYTCPDGTIVSLPSLCNSGVVRDVSSVPWVYRGLTAQYLNSVDKTNLSFYDTGLLHALYDFTLPINGATKVVNTSPNKVALMSHGVAAKGGSGLNSNLQLQVPNNSFGNGASTVTWQTLNTSSIPLVNGANSIMYCETGTTCPTITNWNSTEFASLIGGYAPKNDPNAYYTSMGFSNASVNWMALTGSTTSYTLANRFNSMTNVSDLIAYDWDTGFNAGTDSLRNALFSTVYNATTSQKGYFLQNPNNKIMILPLGDSIQNVSDARYTNKANIYLNNLYYTAGMANPTSFASRLIPSEYLNRTTNSMLDTKKSMPVVAVPVMNIGDFTNGKLQYFLPDTSYNAGALSNIALSVPTSPYQVIYYYDATSGNIRSGMAGFNKDWGSTGTAVMAPDRQAAAILTAAIANVQNAKYGGTSLTMHDALVVIAKQSTPMYGDISFSGSSDSISNAIKGTTFTTNVVSNVVTNKGYRPNTLVINKSSIASLSTSAQSSNVGNVSISGLNASSSNAQIGTAIAKITSNDIVVMDGSSIIAMNDVYKGQTGVIMGYNADGSTQTDTVDRIIYSTSSVKHDNELNPTYYAFYFCKAGESDGDCKQPVRRIASRTFGFGLLNLRMLSTSILNQTVARGTSSVKTVASSGIVSSPAFGEAFTQQALNIQTNNTNIAGEKWQEYTDARFRVDSTQNTSPFNALFVSNAFYSNINNKYYNFNLGNGAFGMNVSSINSYSMADQHSPLLNSRFSDLTPMVSASRNAFGVIAESESVASNVSNISYQGNFAGVNFAFRSNYMPGLDIRDSSNVGINFLRFASLNYNPFTALVSNSFNAHGIIMEKSFYNGLKIGFGTVFGSSNFNSSTLYNNALFNLNQSPSANVASTVSVERNKSGNIIGIEAGVLRESNTLLGTYSSGAFLLGQNNTTIFGKTKLVQKMFGNISVIGSFAIGRTQAGNNDGSLFTGVSQIISRSFLTGVRFEKFLGGTAELTYTQPLANISGGAQFIGTNGNMVISFVPTAIEQDFGISYSINKNKTRFSVQGAYMLNRNNIANVEPTVGFFLTGSKEL